MRRKIHQVRPKVVHVIGDSHALAFKNKSIAYSEVSMIFSTSVAYIRGLRPDVLLENGRLNQQLAEYLVKERIITPNGKPISATDDRALLSEQYATGSGFEMELVVFHVGEIYVRKYLGTHLQNGEFDKAKIESDLSNIVESYVKDVFTIARNFGLTPVVHEITPPTADDSQFERINQFSSSREHRAYAYECFNKLLAEYVTKHSCMLCPSSDRLADNEGCLKAEYEFDGVHADPKYALMSLCRVADLWLYSRAVGGTKRYGRWFEITRRSIDLPKISQVGVSDPEQIFDQAQVERIRKSIGPLDFLACKKPALDWSHAAPFNDTEKSTTEVKYGAVDASGLELLHEVLVDGSAGDSIRSLIGSKFAIINVRAVESAPHADEGVGPQKFHRDHCPIGIYRGLLYLVDVDEGEGGFEYQPLDGSPEPKQILGKAGALFLFDANAVDHRGSPPRTTTRLALDFVILTVPEEAEEIVHCAPLGYIWPVDPYMFSLSGACYPKQKSDRWFYPSLITAGSESARFKPL